ncbi:MAG: S-layer protein [Candidatus Aenigmarchaeota archaeon]|nr:S-layer protein [Candidatus Aenigmarchaeota archaeon]MDW8149616.1 S-layer protein [Candidatus Aenigmarchaeota archaeon]
MRIPRILTNEKAVRILELLSKTPLTVFQISEMLKMHEQTVYYYIKKLREENLIEILREEKVRGFIEKYYFAIHTNLLKPFKDEKKIDENLKIFFSEFFSTGYFNGYVVVGSPLPHGPFLTSARDLHYAAQLSFILGKLGDINNNIIIKLDTEVKAEKLEKNNLILIGGPVSNMISYEINSRLKIKFSWEKSWYISLNGEKYFDEECCLICKVSNPFDEYKKIIMIAGIRFSGTRGGVFALTNFYKKILKNYKGGDFYCLIKGLDKNGDGIEDDIKILHIE